MSTLFSQARARVPRFAEAAVERARLTVVPARPLRRTQAARTPFVVLVLTLLAGGVVGLLMFNTSMQQRSFQATALQQRMEDLTAEEQSLSMQLDGLRDPQHLAVAAKRLGMVAPAQPAFVRLGDGRVLGTPAPAGPDGAVRINPLPPAKPRALSPPPLVIRVPAPEARRPTHGSAKPSVSGPDSSAPNSSGTTGGASTTTTDGAGRKNQTAQAGPGATH